MWSAPSESWGFMSENTGLARGVDYPYSARYEDAFRVPNTLTMSPTRAKTTKSQRSLGHRRLSQEKGLDRSRLRLGKRRA